SHLSVTCPVLSGPSDDGCLQALRRYVFQRPAGDSVALVARRPGGRVPSRLTGWCRFGGGVRLFLGPPVSVSPNVVVSCCDPTSPRRAFPGSGIDREPSRRPVACRASPVRGTQLPRIHREPPCGMSRPWHHPHLQHQQFSARSSVSEVKHSVEIACAP